MENSEIHVFPEIEERMVAAKHQGVLDDRAYSRWAAHRIAWRLLNESGANKHEAREVALKSNAIAERLKKYGVLYTLHVYATKVCLEQLI